MKDPVLLIMAAGMGSRYGGLKQMDPIGPNEEIIIDYSIYDAIAAGFKEVVLVIKQEIEKDFRQIIGGRIAERIKTEYAFQETDQLPPGYSVPEGRVKPWGTTHAILAAKALIEGPFAVINADDYYGPAAFRTMYGWLAGTEPGDGRLHYSMVGYRVENTLSASGGVTRGVCETDSGGYLTNITERKNVERTPGGARFSDDGEKWTDIPAHTTVSMNFWGLQAGFMKLAERDFIDFLDNDMPGNPLKSEYLLPEEINNQLRAGEADVRVLTSADIWYGVTYKDDKPIVQRAIADKHTKREYPTPLWNK